MDRTSTRVGPYQGITSSSSWGGRNVHDSSRPIGDDSFLFGTSKEAFSVKFKQNNPDQIVSDMNVYGNADNNANCLSDGTGWKGNWPNWTGQLTYDSDNIAPEITCALNVSSYEDTLQGDALFGDSTGQDDDLKQSAFCNCDNTYPPNPQYAEAIASMRQC